MSLHSGGGKQTVNKSNKSIYMLTVKINNAELEKVIPLLILIV